MYQTPFVLLGKACLVSQLSFWISNLTGGAVHRYVVCLIMGVIAQEIGFLEHDVMKKSNCYGIGHVICMDSILEYLTAVTPQELAAEDLASMLNETASSTASGPQPDTDAQLRASIVTYGPAQVTPYRDGWAFTVRGCRGICRHWQFLSVLRLWSSLYILVYDIDKKALA